MPVLKPSDMTLVAQATLQYFGFFEPTTTLASVIITYRDNLDSNIADRFIDLALWYGDSDDLVTLQDKRLVEERDVTETIEQLQQRSEALLARAQLKTLEQALSQQVLAVASVSAQQTENHDVQAFRQQIVEKLGYVIKEYCYLNRNKLQSLADSVALIEDLKVLPAVIDFLNGQQHTNLSRWEKSSILLDYLTMMSFIYNPQFLTTLNQQVEWLMTSFGAESAIQFLLSMGEVNELRVDSHAMGQALVAIQKLSEFYPALDAGEMEQKLATLFELQRRNLLHAVSVIAYTDPEKVPAKPMTFDAGTTLSDIEDHYFGSRYYPDVLSEILYLPLEPLLERHPSYLRADDVVEEVVVDGGSEDISESLYSDSDSDYESYVVIGKPSGSEDGSLYDFSEDGSSGTDVTLWPETDTTTQLSTRTIDVVTGLEDMISTDIQRAFAGIRFNRPDLLRYALNNVLLDASTMTNAQGLTLLMEASRLGNIGMMKYLVQHHHVDLSETHAVTGLKAMHMAAMGQQLEAMALLLKFGDAAKTDDGNLIVVPSAMTDVNDCLCSMILIGDTAGFDEYVEDLGIDLTHGGITPYLNAAVQIEDEETRNNVLLHLLNVHCAKAEVTVEPETVFIAMKAQQYKSMEMLLEKMTNVSDNAIEAFMQFAIKQPNQVALNLVASKFDVRKKPEICRSSVMMAVILGDVKMLQTVVEKTEYAFDSKEAVQGLVDIACQARNWPMRNYLRDQGELLFPSSRTQRLFALASDSAEAFRGRVNGI